MIFRPRLARVRTRLRKGSGSQRRYTPSPLVSAKSWCAWVCTSNTPKNLEPQRIRGQIIDTQRLTLPGQTHNDLCQPIRLVKDLRPNDAFRQQLRPLGTLNPTYQRSALWPAVKLRKYMYFRVICEFRCSSGSSGNCQPAYPMRVSCLRRPFNCDVSDADREKPPRLSWNQRKAALPASMAPKEDSCQGSATPRTSGLVALPLCAFVQDDPQPVVVRDLHYDKEQGNEHEPAHRWSRQDGAIDEQDIGCKSKLRRRRENFCQIAQLKVHALSICLPHQYLTMK